MVQKCRDLRASGRSLCEIVRETGLPKTTAFGYVKDITLTVPQKKRLASRSAALRRTQPNPRKGKALFGLAVKTPLEWSIDLVHLVAHFMFDGHVSEDGCYYYSRSFCQVEHVKRLVERIFGVESRYYERADGVKVIAFYNVELVSLIKSKMSEILTYVERNADSETKRIFCRAFFDDEGNVYIGSGKKRVRGYQKDRRVLTVVQRLLAVFGIRSKIYPSTCTLEVADRESLGRFATEINFSAGICLNSLRKNSIWKRDVEKRKVLQLAISSFA